MTSHDDYARIPYVRRCVVVRKDHPLEGMLCNLSVLGVYVTFPGHPADKIPDVEERVEISFLLPGGIPVETEATVTWQNPEEPEEADSLPPGCGLRFAAIRQEDHQKIDEIVRDYTHSSHPQTEVPPPYSGYLRIPYVQPCLLVGDTGTWQGVISNVSLLGAYVAVDPIPAAGESVRLLFWLPHQPHPAEVPAEVAWLNPEEPRRADSLPAGCGIRFLSLPPPVRDRLDALIREYLSVPRGKS